MEYNTIVKKITPNTLRIAYLYPSIYEAMLSSLVTHIIYFMVNEYFPEVFLERFYVKKLKGREPPPRSIDTQSPLKDFDLIITSLHYEPDIANIIRVLYAAGIDPLKKRRKIPILAGGPAVMANPHPYTEFIDAFIIGDAEPTIPEIINIWIQYHDNKKLFLEEISQLDYVYVPSINDEEKIYRKPVQDLNNTYYPIKQIQNTEKEPIYGKGLLLETSRGCKYWCRFCMETRIMKPYRYRSFQQLKNIVEKGIEINKVDRTIIYSLSFLENHEEQKLLDYLIENNFSASLPSLRINKLSEDILEKIKLLGQKTLTLAPENFSYYVQRIISKYLKIDELIPIIYRVLNKGFNLKLYIISGFKGENKEDIDITIEKIKKMAEHARKKGRKLGITINPLIPKPKTVFQWIGMIDLDRARKIINYYRKMLRGLVDTRPYYVNWAWVQASISLADKTISRVLLDWALRGGDLGSWRRALRENNYSTEYVFKGYRFGEELPWDNIVLGYGVEDVLEKEYLMYEVLSRKSSYS